MCGRWRKSRGSPMADKTPKFHPINLGPLPHDRVSAVLGVVMAEGIVHYSAQAQMHSYERHPDTFHLCEPFLAMAVASPTYIGQGPKYKDIAFEHVFRAPGELNVLVAIMLRTCNYGLYRIQSVYPIDLPNIMRRVRKGFLTEM